MSPVSGAIGAGVALAALIHEHALAREAARIDATRLAGEEFSRMHEAEVRAERLQRLREITDARTQNTLMSGGIMPMVGGSAARAVYLAQRAGLAGKVGY